ncbi:hypothetical protein PISMIDRAFT_117515 [Pisolithus microcarpus 441]|uniref:Uncharacterized protein n=1 Tax=Pisolithus microcarpus 441 TaxID=765257 RepID=A0A0C9YBH4_9AGAM|nr:hypothetical protein PISMIDRAFT_117515 [Pisolithus microcarpus 441]
MPSEQTHFPSPSHSPSNSASTHISRCRDQLLNSGFYLADGDILKNVEWIRQGRSHYLAAVEENSDQNSLSATHQLAELSAIVFIDSKNYWLTSDGGYRKGVGMWNHLYDVKPSCTISELPMHPAKADFCSAMKNLRILMQKIGTPGYEKGKGFVFYDNSSPSPTRFKIRHCLFEVHGDDFLPQNIRLTQEGTRDELFDLQKTHRMVPLQARGEDGYILSPAAYRSHLENTVVELQFNLWHWPIAPRSGSSGKDSFTADIVQIRVLVPPPPPVSNSPAKRKIGS